MNCCSKSGVQNYVKNNHIHVEIIHKVAMFSSVDLPNDQEDCVRIVNCGWKHVQIVWPLFAFSFWTHGWSDFAGCIGIPRCPFTWNGFHQDCLFSKTTGRQGMHLAAALGNSTLRRIFILLSGFTLAMNEYPRTFGCNRTFRGWRTCRNIRGQVHRCRFRFCQISSPVCSCILFTIDLGAACHAGILSAACRAEMHDVEKKKKIIPFVTCEITCGQNVYRLRILESRSILSSYQFEATLWVLDTCLTVELLLFMIILITASLFSKRHTT